jgi:hypothetical protein
MMEAWQAKGANISCFRDHIAADQVTHDHSTLVVAKTGKWAEGNKQRSLRECGEEGEPIARVSRCCLNDYASNNLKEVARSEPENNADLTGAV